MANPKTFDVLIEIPKGSRNKYEYDFDLKKISKFSNTCGDDLPPA